MKSKSKVYVPSDDEFKELVATHKNYSDCMRALGLSPLGTNSRICLKKRIKELSIDTSHFKMSGKKQTVSYRYPLDAILCKDSFYSSSETLKKRLVHAGLMEYRCASCGNTGEWNGKSLVLQLDHINGDHFDNRLENLRLLCPNCHSQTETFATRKTKINKPGEKPGISEMPKFKERMLKKNAKRAEEIRKANIDFSSHGWAKEVNKILGYAYPSRVPQWLRKYMPDEYAKTWNNRVADRVNTDAMVEEYKKTDISLTDLAKKFGIAVESARSILTRAGIHDTSRKSFVRKNAPYYHHKIEMDDENGKHIFDSMEDIENYLLGENIVTETNKNRVRANVGRCLNGARKTAFNRAWKII